MQCVQTAIPQAIQEGRSSLLPILSQGVPTANREEIGGGYVYNKEETRGIEEGRV